MKRTYKEKIINLLQDINNEKFLKYLYILISEMVAKSKNK
jgi:hypothetical protein